MRPRGELRPEDLTVVIDTREQMPLELENYQVRVGNLPTGDYSIAGLEHVVCVERKSLADLIQCCGRERERFDACCQRMLGYPARMLLIESSWSEIAAGMWRGQVTPATVHGSLLGWMAAGIPVMLAGNRTDAAKMVARFLYIAARRRWREAQVFLPNLKITGGPGDAGGDGSGAGSRSVQQSGA